MNGQKPIYKVLWTWDYCTFWDDSYYIRGRGAFGENKRRSHFLQDYKRMVDFCRIHGINGIVIWGALRAHDNGEEQFKELVRYGKANGVRIMPGVGLFSYGGVYYDTRKKYDGWLDIPMEPHPYSLHSWLREHPEYVALDADKKPYKTGMYSDIACPSNEENIKWYKRALEWLFTEFGVDGVQIEIGDYNVCHCDKCEKKRGKNEAAKFIIEDMIEPYASASEVIKKINPDAWIICETYSSFAIPKNQEEGGGLGPAVDETRKMMLGNMPQNTILQWVMDRAVGENADQIWGQDVIIPHEDNISRIHAGSQHSLNSTEEWAVHIIGDMVKKARLSGINGVSIFGEESPASPPNEANYLLFSEFCGCGKPNPDCDMELFYAQTLDQLYGGSGMTDAWEKIYSAGHLLRLGKNLIPAVINNPQAFHPVRNSVIQPGFIDKVRVMNSAERQKTVHGLINEAHSISSQLSGESCRRWAWLENWLWRSEFLYRTSVDD